MAERVVVSIRLDPTKIDAEAKRDGQTRSGMVRVLVAEALAARRQRDRIIARSRFGTGT